MSCKVGSAAGPPRSLETFLDWRPSPRGADAAAPQGGPDSCLSTSWLRDSKPNPGAGGQFCGTTCSAVQMRMCPAVSHTPSSPPQGASRKSPEPKGPLTMHRDTPQLCHPRRVPAPLIRMKAPRSGAGFSPLSFPEGKPSQDTVLRTEHTRHSLPVPRKSRAL